MGVKGMSVSQAELRRNVQRALRAQDERLQKLSRVPDSAHLEVAGTERRRRVLAFMLEGLDSDEVPEVAPGVIGFGSHLVIRDLDTDVISSHRIMSGDALDLDEGHMSIDSALGFALVGRSVGEVVAVDTPGGRRTLRIEQFQTLFDLLDEVGGTPPVAPVKNAARPSRRVRPKAGA